MNDPSVLLVGSDVALNRSIQSALSHLAELRVGVVSELDEANPILRSARVTLLVVHLSKGVKGAQIGRFVQQNRRSYPGLTTVVLSDRHRPDQALKLLGVGVAEYLTKPFDLARLASLTERALGMSQAMASDAFPEQEAVHLFGEESPFVHLQSPVLCQIMTHVKRVAPLPTNILLTGETGTGKTRMARLVHALSPRRQEPFFVVNCGALSVNLIESEMFGHVRGAFTGADRDHVGKLAAAGMGTLLFDEIDSLPIEWQSKLLRVIEERVFEPVGSNKSQAVQARFIAASNRDLETEVAAGRFRSDLFHRLNVVSFRLPPLRELPELIPPLVNNFFAELSSRTGSQAKGISSDVVQALCRYPWPGNVRELRNVIERAISLCARNEIQLDDLPKVVQTPGAREFGYGGRSGGVVPFPMTDRRVADRRMTDRRVGDRRAVGGRRSTDRLGYPLHENGQAVQSGNGHAGSGHPVIHLPTGYSNSAPTQDQGNGKLALPVPTQSSRAENEIAAICQALRRNNNNRLRTAMDLGISRMTLYKKLRRYGLFTPATPNSVAAVAVNSTVDDASQVVRPTG